MTRNPSTYLFSTKATCCQEYYPFTYSECMGGSSSGSGLKWYADWTSGDETCKNDGKAPKYMIDHDQDSLKSWLFDDLEDCCSVNFSYTMKGCLASGNSYVGSRKYYPDWNGQDETSCKIDDASSPAPEYMHQSGEWFFDDIEKYCEHHFSFNKGGCMRSSGEPSSDVGSNKWYVDWAIFRCVKNCESGSSSKCGGFAGNWDILYKSQSQTRGL